MKARCVARTLIIAGVSAALASACGGASGGLFSTTGKHADESAMPTFLRSSTASALPDFSSLVQKYGPAVVNVSVTEGTKAGASAPTRPDIDPNNPLWQFFRSLPMPKA